LSGQLPYLPGEDIDGRLIGGSLLLGIGSDLSWPAITDIGFLDRRAALCVLAMAFGIALRAVLTAVQAKRIGQIALDDG
jgi:hypothetical protein